MISINFKKIKSQLNNLLLKELNAIYLNKNTRVAFSLIMSFNISINCFL